MQKWCHCFTNFVANEPNITSFRAINGCVINLGIYTILLYCFIFTILFIKYLWMSTIFLISIVFYSTEKSYTFPFNPVFFKLPTIKCQPNTIGMVLFHFRAFLHHSQTKNCWPHCSVDSNIFFSWHINRIFGICNYFSIIQSICWSFPGIVISFFYYQHGGDELLTTPKITTFLPTHHSITKIMNNN